MFIEWGFLMGELWLLLLLAALIGLLTGWIIWGRRSETEVIHTGEAEQLGMELDDCRALHADKDARISDLEAQLANMRSAAPVATAVAAQVKASADPENLDFDGDGLVEGGDVGVKPATLDAPRGGAADDLKQIKGIGPKMEKLCNKLGFWHFDQIANWSTAEVGWVDANLEGFKGRVTRDTWVVQATLLAAGGETEFSKKVAKGGVY
jgi:predicted flap endonuclease-1-like 5' DNA nuclease